MSKKTKTLIKLITLGLLTVCALIPFISFGWFSGNDKTPATGMAVTVKSSNLEIRATPDGPDIGALEHSSGMGTIKCEDSDQKTIISPSSQGYFEFYVHNPGATEYTLKFNADIKNNEFTENEGLKKAKDNYDEEIITKSLRYVRSHIMMFTDRTGENGNYTYSGYIAPGEEVSKAVTADNIVEDKNGESLYKATVYWVWVSYYDEIFTNTKTLIEENTRQNIASYYEAEEHSPEMFEGNKNQDGYDQADSIIGSTIKNICFSLNVWEG